MTETPPRRTQEKTPDTADKCAWAVMRQLDAGFDSANWGKEPREEFVAAWAHALRAERARALEESARLAEKTHNPDNASLMDDLGDRIRSLASASTDGRSATTKGTNDGE